MHAGQEGRHHFHRTEEKAEGKTGWAGVSSNSPGQEKILGLVQALTSRGNKKKEACKKSDAASDAGEFNRKEQRTAGAARVAEAEVALKRKRRKKGDARENIHNLRNGQEEKQRSCAGKGGCYALHTRGTKSKKARQRVGVLYRLSKNTKEQWEPRKDSPEGHTNERLNGRRREKRSGSTVDLTKVYRSTQQLRGYRNRGPFGAGREEDGFR